MTKHSIYMMMAFSYSNFSKCTFTKVAALGVNENGRIIATAVNGTISGEENCCDHHFNNREEHILYTEENEIHAEENLILELASSSVTFNKLSIYTTISPCSTCLKHLLGLTRSHAGNKIQIDKIVYFQKYHRITDDKLLEMKAKAQRVGTLLLSLEEANEMELNK